MAAEYGPPPAAARLRADLVRALAGGLDVAARLDAREAAYGGRPGGVRAGPPPQVTVAPVGSRRATVLEVRAQDAPGLLFRVVQAIERAGLRVHSAHVGTLGADAVDGFYVTDADGARLPDETAASVARAVQRALSAQEAGQRSHQGS